MFFGIKISVKDILNTWNARCPQFYNATTPLCTFLVPLFGIAKLLISIYFARYARFFCHCTDFYTIFFLLFAKEVDVFVAVFFKKGIDTCHCPKVATMNHFGLPGIWVWIKSLAL